MFARTDTLSAVSSARIRRATQFVSPYVLSQTPANVPYRKIFALPVTETTGNFQNLISVTLTFNNFEPIRRAFRPVSDWQVVSTDHLTNRIEGNSMS